MSLGGHHPRRVMPVTLLWELEKMLLYLISSLLLATALAGSYGNEYSSARFAAPLSRDSLPEATSPIRATPIPITRHSMRNDHRGNYELDFESGDGTKHSSKSVLKKIGDAEVAVQSGTISWTSPEGVLYTLNYVADETGFHPVGDHLPTPPPVPEEHRRALPTLEEQRNQEDSYYGYETPGYSSNYGPAAQPPPSRPEYTSDYSDNYNEKPVETFPPAPPPPMPQTTFRPLPVPQQTTSRPLPLPPQSTFRPLPLPQTTFRPIPMPETTFRPLPPVPETTFRPLPMPQSTFRPMASITGRPPRPRPPTTTTEAPLFPGSLPVDSINLSPDRPFLTGANIISAPVVPILTGPGNGNFRTFVNTTHVLIDSDNARTILRIRQPPMQKF